LTVQSSLLQKAHGTLFTAWHTRQDARLPYRSKDEILALQSRRIRAIVAHAYERVPHYRDVMTRQGLRPTDFHTTEDLAQLPILTGTDVASSPERFSARDWRPGDGLEIVSSGTSGRTKTIRYDARALLLSLAHGRRQQTILAQFVGREYRYRDMLAVRPGSVNLQIRSFYESRLWIPPRARSQRALLSPTASLDDAVARINEYRPDVLRGYGSHLGALFRRAWERGLGLASPRVIVYGADQMPDADRRLIETEFGTIVLSSYQAVEALRLAFQCERREGLHVSIDQVAARVVGGEGRTLGPGERGEIVISNLTNYATVLLNYKLGDLVTVGRATCPCGRTLPTLEAIEGRAEDLVALPSGGVAHPLAVLEELRGIPGVVQVQLVQEELRRFVVRAVWVGDSAQWPAVSERLSAALRATVGQEILVDVERRKAIPADPSGKVRSVVSRCV
jgi:phenylacetate-CoA ligase